ncbi:Phosphatidate phosphatase LPIN3, partial [Dictyocoela roeselum]
MEIVNTLYNSVADFYNTINPNTLSGASDIIVVRHRIKDIASNKIKYVYTCTPFHVRFGTLQMFRISMKTVHLIVNNRMTDIAMKIGRNGDLYFELEDSENEDGVEVYEDRAVLNIRMKDDGLIESGFLSDSAVCDGVCEARKIRHKLLKKSASKKMIDFTNDDKYKNSDHKDNPRNNSFYHQNSDHNDNLENKSFYYQNSSSEIITPYKISTIAVDSPSKHSLTTSTPPLEKSNPDLLTAPKFNLIRSQNYEIRSFMKNIRGFDADFYKRKYIFSSFKNFLVSLEHLDFIFKNYYRYEILVKNLLKIGINQSRECVERDFNKNKDSINDNPINNKYINNFRYCSPCKNDFTNTPCTSVSIRYSKCLNSILDGSPETVFENYLVRDIQKFNELIVEIKSCERCRIKFYLPFDLFSESVFLIQSFYSQDGCFRSTCEERGNESKLKCNYFKETKTNSKDTSKINQGKNIQNQHKNIQHNQNGKDCKQSQSPAKYNSRINSTTINKNSCINSHKKSKLSATTRKNKFGKFLEKRFSITKNWFYAPEVKKIRKSFKLSSDQLERLDLKNGRNSVVFKVGGVDQQIEAFIY